MKIDLSLARKYSRPGPRYTSYPTALHFETLEDVAPCVEASCSGEGPLSLYVHIPFCETLCAYCACHTVTTRDHGRSASYLDALEKEWQLVSERLETGRELVQVHLGGGTPNFLTPEEILRLGQIVAASGRMGGQVEFGVELDPRRLSWEQVQAFRQIGANRASFGVQDVEPLVQQAVRRIQPDEKNEQAMAWLRAAGFASVNIDLIYGLPLQTTESFSRTLDAMLRLKPDRFAVFGYAHVPWMKPAQKGLEADLPDVERRLALHALVVERLTGSGYVHIGMDHFAREEDELVHALHAGVLRRNFQGYSTQAGADVVGLGVSAISQSERAYRQNEKALAAYQETLAEGRLPVHRGIVLSEDDRLRRLVIHRLLCEARLDFAELEAHTGVAVQDYFSEALSALAGEPASDGLVEVDDRGVWVTATGRFFLRNLAMFFDGRRNAEADVQRYSRTV